MCGIAGILSFEANAPIITGNLIEQMRDSMVHRGPDESGIFRDSHIALGQRRLSIIDLAGGSQPMCNADQSIWVLNNGEIYNYQQVRAELEKRGFTFRTNSDTEVIIHGYRAFGECVVDHLRGMFAAVVWDVNAKTLWLMRDRVGKKPLYYARLPEGLFFASEIKALLHYEKLPRELDTQALAEYFTYQSIPDPLTVFKSVRKLPPGHLLRCDVTGRLEVRRYWRWSLSKNQPITLAYQEAVQQVRHLLEEAVRLRMISDVPLGALLSGGVDSSAVVAMMAQHASGAVKTFTIGFQRGEYDERPFARQIAEMCSTDHHEWVVEPEHIHDVLPKLARQYDEPFADPSALPTYYVCKMARQHVTVALAGDGGDEGFAGYDRYAKFLRLNHQVQPLAAALMKVLPFGAHGRRTLRLLAVPPDERYQRMNTLFEAPQLERLLNHAPENSARHLITAIMRELSPLPILSRLQVADFELYLPSTVLVKVDRASMLNSLEVRAPLLDHELLDFVGMLPAEWQLGKRVLKDALRGVVPESLLNRPKTGFGVPLEHWFDGNLGDFLREILLDTPTRQRGLLNTAYVERLINRQGQFWAELTGPLWAVLMFELWCRAYQI